MPKRLRDQVIVITGASSGIGLATAKAAALGGAKVVLSARSAADLERAVDEIRRAGGDAIAVPADVTRFEDMQRLAQGTIDVYGRIDTWVNNAGVTVFSSFNDLSLDDARRIMDVNFFGQVHGAKAALPHLERTRGALVCVGSALSDRGMPLMGMYSASKHALKGWLDALRVELKKAGSAVRVSLVKPGSIDTPLYQHAKTQLGVAPRPIRPFYAPELAADAILRAATGNVREAFVGGAAKLLSIGERISPRLVDASLRLYAFRAHKTDRPESSSAPSNLYAPVSGDGGARGRSRHIHRRSLYQAIESHAILASLVAAGLLALAAHRLRR